MHSITVFLSAALLYCIGTAVASQSDKTKFYSMPRNAATAASRTIKMGKTGQATWESLVTLVQSSNEQDFHISIAAPQGTASQLHFREGHKKSLSTPFKTLKITKIKVEDDSDDSDRHLAKEGSIRGGKMEDSFQHKPSLQDWNTAFEANIAMPVRLQSIIKETSGASNLRLQTAACFEQDNGLLACVLDGYPGEGASAIFLDCPVSVTSVFECQSCTIMATVDSTSPLCNSCDICSDTVAYDCSNLFEGDCVTVDCNGNCTGTDLPTPPYPDPTSPPSGVIEVPCYEQANASIVSFVFR